MIKHIGSCDCNILIRTHKSKDPSIKYLTGLDVDFAILVTFKSSRKKPVLLISPLERKPQRSDLIVKNADFTTLTKIIKSSPVKTIGLNYNEIKLTTYQLIKKHLKEYNFKDITNNLTKARSVKHKEEIKLLKKAIDITEQILKELIDLLPTFTYEIEGIKYIKRRAVEFGVELAFEPIIASGKNAAIPHHVPNEQTKLQKGFCIIDVGMCYEGYHADISRTVFIGKPTQKDKLTYERVLKDQLRLEKELKAGSSKAQTKLKINHALGHGIGLDIHEPPHLGHEKLKAHMTIAVEPAEYVKGQGIRIEDDYVVTKHGLERLSTGSRELICIPLTKKK